VIREALWWLDEHRRLAAIGGVALVLTAAAAAFLAAGAGGEDGSSKTPAIEATLRSDDVAPSPPDRGLGGSPEAQTKEHGAVDEKDGLAEGPREGGQVREQVGKASPLSGCESFVGGAVVEVSVSSGRCADASRIAEAYREGPRAASETVSGFDCTHTDGSLVVSCLRARDGSAVTVHFGPGGRGLEDCGPVPLGEEPLPVPLRASIDCQRAGPIAFAYGGGEGGQLDGFECSERAQVGVPVVECSRGGEIVAFAATS
jgi:hypothetical protein